MLALAARAAALLRSCVEASADTDEELELEVTSVVIRVAHQR